jgi:hypothetical protein
MNDAIEGLKEFKQFLNKLDDKVDEAIENALQETSEQCAKEASELSPVKTGTLRDSWEVVKNEDKRSTHAMTVWSDMGIIDTNPDHPRGEYYSHLIENGFVKPDGKRYKGKHMLKLAFSNCKRNLKANLRKELGSAFNNES